MGGGGAGDKVTLLGRYGSAVLGCCRLKVVAVTGG